MNWWIVVSNGRMMWRLLPEEFPDFIYTCAVPTLTCQKGFCEKKPKSFTLVHCWIKWTQKNPKCLLVTSLPAVFRLQSMQWPQLHNICWVLLSPHLSFCLPAPRGERGRWLWWMVVAYVGPPAALSPAKSFITAWDCLFPGSQAQVLLECLWEGESASWQKHYQH